jgi:hypothetical protein
MFMHSQWIEGMNYDFGSFIKPINRGALGLGVYYLRQGEFEGRDENRNLTGNFTASDLAISLSVGRRIPSGSIGMNLKIINESIETERATGVAVDLGYKYQKYGGVPRLKIIPVKWYKNKGGYDGRNDCRADKEREEALEAGTEARDSKRAEFGCGRSGAVPEVQYPCPNAI